MKALHAWELTPKEAAALQVALRSRLSLVWEERPVETVAGVDVHFDGDRPLAAIALFSFPALEPLEKCTARLDHSFPYIPGLLAFREGPAVMAAWRGLERRPDLVLFDSQGIAHPRGLGLASHLGLWLDLPTIGAAKSRLFGDHEEPKRDKGSIAELWDEADPGHQIGAVVRTRTGVRPVYVSPGHMIDVETSVKFVLSCCTRYRLPEPTRWAHRVADGADFPP